MKTDLKLTSREYKKENTIIQINKDIRVGDKEIVIIAGPCSVESKEQIFRISSELKKYGVHLIRAGAFKPRSSPYSFQGLGHEALQYLKEVKEKLKIGIVTEVMSIEHLKEVEDVADIIQIGARNAQNFELLKKVGKSKKPVLLKRGIATTIHEWLMSAEHIMVQGNHQIILCERGIRTFENSTRFTLDLNAIPAIKKMSHLPIIIDPSHGTGVREFVPSMSKAAIAAGADGLIIEVHDKPEEALSDGPQSIVPEEFKKLVNELRGIAKAVNRKL
ncbi:MAG: 3-deoxy-7-phosphoheptulonate synthase [Candidatus Pacearchaeota archaeon]